MSKQNSLKCFYPIFQLFNLGPLKWSLLKDVQYFTAVIISSLFYLTASLSYMFFFTALLCFLIYRYNFTIKTIILFYSYTCNFIIKMIILSYSYNFIIQTIIYFTAITSPVCRVQEKIQFVSWTNSSKYTFSNSKQAK